MIKQLLTAAIALSALFLTSCATFQKFQEFLGTPQAVQTEIAILGGIAKPRLSADAQAKIYQFAVALNQASDLNLDQLYALLPATTGSINGDALISAAKAYVTATVQRYGARNQTAISYARAVAAGLLAVFPQPVALGGTPEWIAHLTKAAAKVDLDLPLVTTKKVVFLAAAESPGRSRCVEMVW